jgi:long-chain acyl-CoA synthetase
MLTTSNVLGLFANLRDRWGFQPGESVMLAMMPMFHIAGLGLACMGLAYGCRTVILRDLVPTEILEVLSREGITHAFMVPAVIQMLLQTPWGSCGPGASRTWPATGTTRPPPRLP